LPTPDDQSAPPRAAESPYRLPSPLSHRGELPVSDSAPRVPRALRAFNGMPPAPPSGSSPGRRPPSTAPARGAAAARGRDGLTIRDLLEHSEPSQPAGAGGLAAGVRAAWGRLRRAVGSPPRDDDEDAG
jgi:hypothetical protein